MAEHYLIKRLKHFLPVFQAYTSRAETVKHVTPAMNISVANIIRDAQVIQAGLGHIDESHFDSPQLGEEFKNLVQLAGNLLGTLRTDGSFWGYILNLVNLETFRSGAEYCEVEQIENFIWVLEQVLAVKLEIRNEKIDVDI